MNNHEFIADIETWGTGGHMLDLMTLKDGSVLMVAEGVIVLYPTRSDFDRGVGGRALQFTSASVTAEPALVEGRPQLRAVS